MTLSCYPIPNVAREWNQQESEPSSRGRGSLRELGAEQFVPTQLVQRSRGPCPLGWEYLIRKTYRSGRHMFRMSPMDSVLGVPNGSHAIPRWCP